VAEEPVRVRARDPAQPGRSTEALRREDAPSAAPDTNTDAAEPKSWTRYLPIALLIVFSTGAAYVSYRYDLLSLEKIVAYRDRLQGFVDAYGPMSVLAYSAIYVTAVALSVPGAVFLTILGGFLFGWLLGGAVASLSATTGAVLVFLIARTSFGDVLVRKAGPRLQTLAEGFREDAFSYLLFLRLLPIMPFWLTNLACALFNVKLETFALATVIGILPATFTFAVGGAGLDSVIAAQKASYKACKAAGGTDCAFNLDIHTILTPQILAAFAALGIMALIPVAVRRWRQRKAMSLDRGDGAS
jgi:uncharacterized membrane protein YdjX (TVP38/TMEM64 family)